MAATAGGSRQGPHRLERHLRRLAPVACEKIVRFVACDGLRWLIEEDLEVLKYGAKPLNRHLRDADSIEDCLVFEAVNMRDVSDITLLACDGPATTVADSFSPLKIEVPNAESSMPPALREAIASQPSSPIKRLARCEEVRIARSKEA